MSSELTEAIHLKYGYTLSTIFVLLFPTACVRMLSVKSWRCLTSLAPPRLVLPPVGVIFLKGQTDFLKDYDGAQPRKSGWAKTIFC